MSNYLSKLMLALKMANHRRLYKRREPQRIAYRQWAVEHDTVNDATRAPLQALYRQLPTRPLISVIMPVYNAPLGWLNDAIRSVQAQIYQEWELCIADDCSKHADLRPFLESKCAEDPRIKVAFRETNGHISAASNSAIELAEGQFLALMDQDDLIPEDALLHVANAIIQHPDAGLIFSDEDKVDENNQREAPIRKKDWGPECILKFNSISHLGVYKTQLVKDIGGFRVGYEGSQDHDLALRCIEQLRQDQIVHIPKILYHWRIHANSTAQTSTAKPYAVTARNNAIQDHLSRKSRQRQKVS